MNFFTYLGVVTFAYLLVYKLTPWLEGETARNNRKENT